MLTGNYKDLESEEARSPFEILEGVSEEEAYLNGKNSLHSSLWWLCAQCCLGANTVCCRGVQDYFAVSGASIAWQVIKTDCGSGYQRDGRCAELAQGCVRVSRTTPCLPVSLLSDGRV